MVLKVACPVCRTVVVWCDENRHRPFCSERCRLLDLGVWADGGYAMPAVADGRLDVAFDDDADGR